MENNSTYEQDLASIHKLMERSVKFISLSGLSGILSGVYALAGAAAAYYRVQYPQPFFSYQSHPVMDVEALWDLVWIAVAVLVASLATGLWLSSIKAGKVGARVWDATGKRLLINLAIPLATGGIFILICASQGYVDLIAPGCLIFYGLALVNASAHLFDEIRYLAYLEILLGLGAAIYPGYALIVWSVGFGLLHIVYGAAMYRKYDR